MRYVITGSRIFQPKKTVIETLENLPDVESLICLGSTTACDVAALWAAERLINFKRSPLDQNRANLYRIAPQDNIKTIFFACRDVNSRNLTAGIGQLIETFRDREYPFDVITSDLPGKVCRLITDLYHNVSEFQAIADGDPESPFWEDRKRVSRKRKAFERATMIGIELSKLSDRLTAKLDSESFSDEWERSLHAYTAIQDALNETKAELSR